MSKTNCRCGRVRTANCIRCGTGTCEIHIHQFGVPAHLVREQNISTQMLETRAIGIGGTLPDAAYNQGYWLTSDGSYVCPGCREKDAEANRRLFQLKSLSWPVDPFEKVVTAITHGLVYDDIGLSYSQVINSWLKLGVETKQVSVVLRVIKLAAFEPHWLTGKRRWKPGKVESLNGPGWEFPNTVWQSSEDIYGIPFSSFSGKTVIFADGRGYFVSSGPLTMIDDQQGNPGRLIVEMARQLADLRGLTWRGPDRDWK